MHYLKFELNDVYSGVLVIFAISVKWTETA